MPALPRNLLKEIRRLQLRARWVVRSSLAGEYRSAFKGTGLSFDEVREYQPGDDVRRIDWNVTARVGMPFVKSFIEERELTVLLAVDVSAGMRFGTGPTTKRSVAAEIAAVLAVCAAGHNDRVGFLAFSDRIERSLRPAKGGSHLLAVLRECLHFTPEHPGTDPTAAWETIARVYRRRAIVVLIGDFLGPLPEDVFRRIAQRHETIAIRIRDQREGDWPSVGLVRLRDLETGDERLIDTSSGSFRSEFHRRQRDRDRDFESLCQRCRVDRVDLDTSGDHFDRLLEYFRSRDRRTARR